jgi:hypothetical protein
MFQSLNLFVSNNAVLFLVALYVIVIVFILAFLSYYKRRDMEYPGYHPTDAERIRVHKEKKQEEHLKHLKELFDGQLEEMVDVEYLDLTGNGRGYTK